MSGLRKRLEDMVEEERYEEMMKGESVERIQKQMQMSKIYSPLKLQEREGTTDDSEPPTLTK